MRIFKNTTNIVLILLIQIITIQAQPNEYPNSDKDYTKKQFDSFVKYYSQIKDTLGLARTYFAYAKNQERLNNPLNNSPLENYRKSMEYYVALGDSSSYNNIRGAIGSYFMDRPFIKKYAKEYICSAVNYFKKSKEYNREIGNLINLANINIHENNYAPALEMLKRCEYLNGFVTDESNIARIFSSYSDVYRRQGKYDLAIPYSKNSYVIAKKMKIGWLEALSLFFIAKSLEGQNNYEGMLQSLNEGLRIVEKDVNQAQLRREYYETYKNYYQLKRDYKKAYEFSQKSNKTTEEIYFSKIEIDVRSFTEYQILEEQKMIISKIELEKQLAEVEIDKLKSRQQFYIFILILAAIFLALITFLFINWRRIGRLKAIEINKNMHIKTLNALIDGQEQERLRVAQELHDGLGTMLSRIKILSGKGTSKEKITQMIDEACSEVRIISGNLQPNTLKNFGLIRAIQDLTLKHQNSSPIIVFQHYGEPFEIDNNKSLMIYRIIQELITNSLKHAKAKEILLQIIFSENNQLTLSIEDDGVGFNENEIKVENNGWTNIKSRINYLNGNLILNSDKEFGTSVTITIPNLILNLA